jgi:pimeloyl-ACP methyl ester carboxylesterase
VAAWCGSIPVLLDPAQTTGPRIRTGFVWFPATDTGPAQGTIVAEEGGPGWSSTGSATEYRALYRPLLATRNLLLVDKRGTGRSTAIDCPGLESYRGTTEGAAFERLVGACGAQLNHTWHGPSGGWEHASDLFTTAYAVNDLADVIRALGVGPVDLYGDSYGTWFAQSFMTYHPQMLRSVVLDSAYPMSGGSAWYLSSLNTARTALRLVCRRDPACQAAGGGDPWARFSRLVARVRAHPIAGGTTTPNGQPVTELVDVPMLVDIATNAGFDPIVYRELDAADRAALAGDDAPILRLAALAQYSDDANPRSARAFSDGFYFADSCTEYTQLFNMHQPPAVRRRELTARIRSADPALFAPFTAAEWGRINAYSEAYEACLDWPSPLPSHRLAAAAHGAPLAPVDLPVLILGGDLDSWTSARFRGQLLAQIGPSARYVELANTVHTSGEGDTTSTASTRCARSLVRAFVAHPAGLLSMNASCAEKVPPIHTPGTFPLTLARETPATVTSGRADMTQRRAVVVAGEAAADAMMSDYADSRQTGKGLRGGSFQGGGWPQMQLTLHEVHWVADARVSGTLAWDANTAVASASLTVRGPGSLDQPVSLRWSENRPVAVAVIPGATLSFAAP